MILTLTFIERFRHKSDIFSAIFLKSVVVSYKVDPTTDAKISLIKTHVEYDACCKQLEQCICTLRFEEFYNKVLTVYLFIKILGV